MRQIKTFEELQDFIKDYEELKRINKRLHRYYKQHCNSGLTNRQLKNCEKLEKEAERITQKWGLILDLCTDPRGVPICLKENQHQFRYAGLVIPLK